MLDQGGDFLTCARCLALVRTIVREPRSALAAIAASRGCTVALAGPGCVVACAKDDMDIETMCVAGRRDSLEPGAATKSDRERRARDSTLAVGRSVVVGLVALAALGVSIQWLDERTPVSTWLAWSLLTIWGWQLVLAASMVLVGHAVVVGWLGVRPRSLAETLAFAVPVGALAFALGIFVAGFLGWLRPWFAVAWPLALVLLAQKSDRTRPLALRDWLHRYRPRSRAIELFSLLATGFGLIAVGLAYLQNFSPDSITFDAAWTHLTIAQDYAREGRIVPFLADWPKNLPHLGSIINTWSFLVPGLKLPAAKYMMALHTEFVFMLWTLVAVAAGMARLGGYRRGGWAAMFLFSAFFVYDHVLGGGADHFLAFWSVPVFLALLEIVTTRATRWWIVLAIVMAGAVMTKMQAVLLVAPAASILVVALLRDLVIRWRQGRWPAGQNPWRGPLAAGATALLLTAPHFGANLAYHHNPFYPFAQDIFTGSTPTVPDATLFADNLLRHWGQHPPPTLARQARTLVNAVATFPCHSDAPESGALFAVALLLAPFLPRARPIWFGLIFALGGLSTWILTYPQSRNLQGILPVVAVVTGAALVRARLLGRLARIGVSALLFLQVIAGFDSFFAGTGRINNAVALIRSSRDRRADSRFDHYQREHLEIGRSLPRNAVVLLHIKHTNLGIDRPILHDALGFQSLIDPRTFRTARQLYLSLKQLGVTHVVIEHNPSAPAETRQGEVVFDTLAISCQQDTQSFGNVRVFPLPADPPPEEPDYEALLVGMSDQPDGLYDVADLDTVETLPARLQARKPPKVTMAQEPAVALIGRARAVLRGRDARLEGDAEQQLANHFDKFGTYDGFTVFVRRR